MVKTKLQEEYDRELKWLSKMEMELLQSFEISPSLQRRFPKMYEFAHHYLEYKYLHKTQKLLSLDPKSRDPNCSEYHTLQRIDDALKPLPIQHAKGRYYEFGFVPLRRLIQEYIRDSEPGTYDDIDPKDVRKLKKFFDEFDAHMESLRDKQEAIDAQPIPVRERIHEFQEEMDFIEAHVRYVLKDIKQRVDVALERIPNPLQLPDAMRQYVETKAGLGNLVQLKKAQMKRMVDCDSKQKLLEVSESLYRLSKTIEQQEEVCQKAYSNMVSHYKDLAEGHPLRDLLEKDIRLESDYKRFKAEDGFSRQERETEKKTTGVFKAASSIGLWHPESKKSVEEDLLQLNERGGLEAPGNGS